MIFKKYGVYSMIQVIICCKNLYVKLKDSGLMGMVVLYCIQYMLYPRSVIFNIFINQ